jgi:hypothetical protein
LDFLKKIIHRIDEMHKKYMKFEKNKILLLQKLKIAQFDCKEKNKKSGQNWGATAAPT